MNKPAAPTLRELALDHIAAIAAELRHKDPTLSREQSIAKAATTTQGREAHALYNQPESPSALASGAERADQAQRAGEGVGRVTHCGTSQALPG